MNNSTDNPSPNDSQGQFLATEIESVVGPQDRVSAKFFGPDPAHRLEGHVFIEESKVGRKEVRIVGWAHIPEVSMREIRFNPPWDTRVQSLRTGIERGDIQHRFGGGEEALRSGFAFSLEIPLWFTGLNFDICFDNDTHMTVRLDGPFAEDLHNRLLRNLGHRYLGWIKPAKKIFRKRFKAQQTPSLQAPGSLRAYYSGSQTGEVIVPIYNGLNYLKPLLPKLCHDTSITRLFLVDDASPDEAVTELLDQTAADHEKVELIRNQSNLGFVKTVNKALRRVTDDCVLLNTDVDVPSEWIGRLLEPIRRDALVATTTPFTNAGTILSFPENLIDNDFFNDIPVDSIDRQFQKMRTVVPIPELPSGIGFCMGMSLKAIQEVGLFDEQSFGRGYGEENDWCQKAIRMGYRNLPVINLYIYHKHGGSYSPEEKRSLLDAHLKLMGRRHPAYHQQVQEFIKSDPLRRHREAAVFQLLAGECARGVAVFFDHAEGGGANLACQRRVAEAQDDELLPLIISQNRGGGPLHLFVQHPRWTGEIDLDNEADLFFLLRSLPIEEIFINSLVFFSHPARILKQITSLAKARPHLLLEIFLHDYHPLCPSHNLIDREGNFCDLPAIEVCRECLTGNSYVIDSLIDDIEDWRIIWNDALRRATTIRAFSDYSARLFLRIFPEMEDSLFVLPHPQYFYSRPAELPPAGEVDIPVVGVVGNIGHAKGASTIVAMAKVTGNPITVIGKLAPGYESVPSITVHGSYDRGELRDLIERYQISVCFIPSIWPETYNFVADELMSLGVPLVSFDVGAQAERISLYKKGKVLSLDLANRPKTLHREIIDFWQLICREEN